jgi:PTH1 family peptidyl-tRNA hydrolase
VVGLGNPGAAYARTRHNAGADTVAVLAQRYGERFRTSRREHSLIAEVRADGQLLVLAFPQTFMNESGRAVGVLVRRYGIEDLARLVIVHDEMDLPLGVVRVKAGGGLAGHNGLRSVKASLHSGDFTRVRIGIGKPDAGSRRGADHVLSPPARRERAELDVGIEQAADAVQCILSLGVAAAQNRFNALNRIDDKCSPPS